ncbi:MULTISPECIES: serine-threonine protein kinase [unclassified Streptomyces]|uniref:serine-threonine protein kinase n=1 Tax=unclassified Streptomyces TaxID=2593676 RepID=UPI002E80EC6A|nr:serine-threonine protein kinase [Streptomyces sp. NBC_00589]WTI40422.1 serine-threonine protein kinase [Streptomyces sp. NBC_00775]WUB25894.1 serine-threonine protein kinase [Streptomyces sp. NBC_00589]
MADPAVSVSPYWELTFDADGDIDGRERDRLLKEVPQRKIRDLVVFAHGWNNDRPGATRLYSHFFEPVPELAPTARLGYVGVVWPSMRFSDEPIPDFPPSVAAGVATVARPVLDMGSRHALLEVFPGRATVVEQIARLLDQQPDEGASLEEFGRLVRLLVEVRPQGPQTAFAADTLAEGVPESDPEMLFGDTATVCGEFAQALAEAETPGAASFALPRLWDGAHELLRQATYYAMKRRAGTIGERGLGRAIGQLAKAAPDVRVHLVGHSFGGRLVSFALRGLPKGVRSVKSVTLLQGAFSHYAFAARLPHDPRASGVLDGQQNRIDGPLVCCYSHFDSALGTIYPLASRMAGDSRAVTADFDIGRTLGAKWGAMGHDGVQAVAGTRTLTLADALHTPLPASGCVNIDAAAVVNRGGPPSGAHSDICHRELAQLVLAAGRVK